MTKKDTVRSVGEDGENFEPACAAGGVENWKNSLVVCPKVTQLSAIPLQDICPREMNTCPQQQDSQRPKRGSNPRFHQQVDG